MNEELVKALTSLIDETIVEIEDLKKSRFSASEISLKGPGEDGIKGHSADGKLDKEEDKKKDEKEKDDKKDDKEDMDKGENNKADPNGGNHKPVAGEGMKNGQGPSESPSGGSSADKSGKNNEADPNGGNHKPAHMSKKEDDEKDEKKEDKKDKKDDKDMEKKEMPKEGYDIKKSLEDHDALMKTYIDGRISTLESKLGGILDLVKKIADQPVAPKGASAKNFAVLSKSDDKASLSKSDVANKLFDLKKSGTVVDSADITAAELGSTDLQAIINKYGLQ